MTHLLDTDTIIYWLKGNEQIEENLTSTGPDNIAISIISKAELYFGAYNSQFIEKNLYAIQSLSAAIRILFFEDDAAEQFGKIKSELCKKGNIIPDADLMIASICIANDLILVTNNTTHFERIEGLKIENWA